jgi:hypothetical protein
MNQPESASKKEDQQAKQPDNNPVVAMMSRDAGNDHKADAAADERYHQEWQQGESGYAGADRDHLVG